MATKHILLMKDTEVWTSGMGGTVTRFRHQNKDVFFEQVTRPDGRVRGGCHACAPWFGQSEFSERKHGHLRDLKDYYAEHHGNVSVMYFGRKGDERYPWRMAYTMRTIILAPGVVQMSLSARNAETSGDPVPTELAFHDYCACGNGKIVVMSNGRTLKDGLFEESAESIDLDGTQLSITTSDHLIDVFLGGAFLSGQGDKKVTFWSDDPWKYGCVEPRLGNLLLQPGQESEISMTWVVTPKSKI